MLAEPGSLSLIPGSHQVGECVMEYTHTLVCTCAQTQKRASLRSARFQVGWWRPQRRPSAQPMEGRAVGYWLRHPVCAGLWALYSSAGTATGVWDTPKEPLLGADLTGSP